MFHVLLRLPSRYAGLKPRDYGQEMRLPACPLFGRERHRHPVIAVLPVLEEEILRHYADYFRLHSVHQNRSPDDRLIAAKAPPP